MYLYPGNLHGAHNKFPIQLFGRLEASSSVFANSELFVKEVQQVLVSLFVGSLDVVLLKISPSCHKAMNLVVEPFDLVRDFQSLLVLFNRLFIFVLGWYHEHGNGDVGSVLGVDHRWMTGGGCFEWCTAYRSEVHDLQVD